MLLLLLACTNAPPGDSAPSGEIPVFDPNPPTEIGGTRPAPVFLPSDYTVDREWPLVIMLHGYGVTASLQDLVFGLGPRVDSLGFILVKPEGTTDGSGYPFWNATEDCCDFAHTGVDDVAYITGLIDESRALYPVSSVALVGHSNGGFMSYRMACEVPERIDRLLVLAGLVYDDESDCVGTAPVSVVHVHGTADDTIAYDSVPPHAGAEESVGRWVTKAGCDPTPAPTDDRDYLGPVDGAETSTQQWSGCAPGVDVQLWTATGGDHTFFPNEEVFKDNVAAWAAGP